MKCLSHYMKEASKQSKHLENKDLYQEVQNDPSISINPIMRALENSGIRGDLSNDTLNFLGFNTSYSSESEFIRKRYKPLFTEN